MEEQVQDVPSAVDDDACAEAASSSESPEDAISEIENVPRTDINSDIEPDFPPPPEDLASDALDSSQPDTDQQPEDLESNALDLSQPDTDPQPPNTDEYEVNDIAVPPADDIDQEPAGSDETQPVDGDRSDEIEPVDGDTSPNSIVTSSIELPESMQEPDPDLPSAESDALAELEFAASEIGEIDDPAVETEVEGNAEVPPANGHAITSNGATTPPPVYLEEDSSNLPSYPNTMTPAADETDAITSLDVEAASTNGGANGDLDPAVMMYSNEAARMKGSNKSRLICFTMFFFVVAITVVALVFYFTVYYSEN